MKRLYHFFSHHWGEPHDLFVFDSRELDHPVQLGLIHVATWLPDEDCDLTSFNTLGMSERLMVGADYFAELNLGYRGDLDEPSRLNMSRLLANVAEYPFQYGLKLDWWETIGNPGSIPLFSGCRHLLLAPTLGDAGLGEVDDQDGKIRLLNVIPITPKERRLLRERGGEMFLDYASEEGIDLFADRHDAPEWYEESEAGLL